MTERKRQIDSLFDGNKALQSGEIARVLGVTRQTAHRHLRQLVAEGRLIAEGAGRGSRYRRYSAVDQRRYPTAGLEEDLVWSEMSGSGSLLGALPTRARTVLQYSLTELVNNAIDHSGAAEVEIRVSEEGGSIELVVRDRGIGIFEHICDHMNLASELEALQELSKGKTTTMPESHTGEGIFFTSKAADRFEIESGTLRWVVDNRLGDMAVGTLDPPIEGTRVRVEVDPAAARELTDVFDEYTKDFEFSRTRTVIKLFAIGTEFVSRSQAKRLLHGLANFREVVLDFTGVDIVGQGFADEVFRIWARENPDVNLVPTEMSDPVAFMVERALRGASALGSNPR
jgi:anti-sigma regulatory factor (Ser/Thr protein kinase)